MKGLVEYIQESSNMFINDDLKNKIIAAILCDDNANNFNWIRDDQRDTTTRLITCIKNYDFKASNIDKIYIDDHAKKTYDSSEKTAEQLFSKYCKIPEKNVIVWKDDKIGDFVRGFKWTISEMKPEFKLFINDSYVYFIDWVGDGGIRLIELK